jgi:hypothetical protein
VDNVLDRFTNINVIKQKVIKDGKFQTMDSLQESRI